MTITKNKLYRWMLLACTAGYAWLFWVSHHLRSGANSFDLCFIKHATNIPCPSCGVTRSAISFLHGDFLKALYLNPLGIAISAILIISPLWIALDYLLRKKTFLNFYLNAEELIRKPAIAVTLSLLVLSNWVWNITKGL